MHSMLYISTRRAANTYTHTITRFAPCTSERTEAVSVSHDAESGIWRVETQSDAAGDSKDSTSDVTSVVQARHVVLAGSGDVSRRLCPELNRCAWVIIVVIWEGNS